MLPFKFLAQCQQGVVKLSIAPIPSFLFRCNSKPSDYRPTLPVRRHPFNPIGETEEPQHVAELPVALLRNQRDPLEESVILGEKSFPLTRISPFQIAN